MAWTNDMRLSAGGILEGRRMNDVERAGRSKEVTYFTSRPSGMRSEVGSSYHLSGLQGEQWPQWRSGLWSEQGSERTSTKEEEDTEDFAGMSGSKGNQGRTSGLPRKEWELGCKRGHQNESPWDEWWPGTMKDINSHKGCDEASLRVSRQSGGEWGWWGKEKQEPWQIHRGLELREWEALPEAPRKFWDAFHAPNIDFHKRSRKAQVHW